MLAQSMRERRGWSGACLSGVRRALARGVCGSFMGARLMDLVRGAPESAFDPRRPCHHPEPPPTARCRIERALGAAMRPFLAGNNKSSASHATAVHATARCMVPVRRRGRGAAGSSCRASRFRTIWSAAGTHPHRWTLVLGHPLRQCHRLAEAPGCVDANHARVRRIGQHLHHPSAMQQAARNPRRSETAWGASEQWTVRPSARGSLAPPYFHAGHGTRGCHEPCTERARGEGRAERPLPPRP